MTAFDTAWARQKIRPEKTAPEMRAYIAANLPELATLPKGLVIDVGPGSGQFLAAAAGYGHNILGIEAPNWTEGDGGMGQPYLDECRRECARLGVPVSHVGLMGFLDYVAEEADQWDGTVMLIHLRGSIEQCLSHVMRGTPHDVHHNCRLVDWDINAARTELRRLMKAFSRILQPGGLCVVAANGSRTTNRWYSDTICEEAKRAGLELVRAKCDLNHTWRKP